VTWIEKKDIRKEIHERKKTLITNCKEEKKDGKRKYNIKAINQNPKRRKE
jgi:hypothetical protein